MYIEKFKHDTNTGEFPAGNQAAKSILRKILDGTFAQKSTGLSPDGRALAG